MMKVVYIKFVFVLKGVSQFFNFFKHSKRKKIYVYIKKNDTKNLKDLIDKGFCEDIVDKKGRTPLMYAIKKKNINIISMLLESDTIKKDINKKDKKGNTALVYAVRYLEREQLFRVVRMLLKNGASAYLQDEYSKSIFDYYKDESMVKQLLKNEKNITEKHCVVRNKQQLRWENLSDTKLKNITKEEIEVLTKEYVDKNNPWNYCNM